MRGSRGASTAERVHVDITGVVQGVGFRPALARIAGRHRVSGFVFNDAGSVHCELQGAAVAIDAVLDELRHQGPPMARIDDMRVTSVPTRREDGFRIVESRRGDDARTLIAPDIATCADCLRELRDPADRRYGHPFITCTNCGPRYTVVTDLPYDRSATTMADFPMCAACAAEYADPADRRFHAQTVACRDCGPVLSWRGPGPASDPLGAAAGVLRAGGVVAVKGIGGYHLACRADDPVAVRELRRRKARPDKPFAVMTADLAAARAVATVDDAAAAALLSAAAPIVLVPRRGEGIPDVVAPGLCDVGLMLAYSPVHHLLFDLIGPIPLVMTSANAGGSPIVYRDADLGWIDGLADGVLTHDRPIHVPCEDSVVMITDGTDGTVVPIRRSRGYAPLPVSVPPVDGRPVVLATGGDVKTTFCLMGSDGRAHMSSHLGDMSDPRTQVSFDAALKHLARMTDRHPDVIACDLHPGYATTGWARRQKLHVTPVQHHHAHAVSLLAEHDRLGEPAVVVAYDGTGYGTDGTIWGGEVLVVADPARFTRIGHVAPFALPGGEGAVRQPARIALELLHRAGVPWELAPAPLAAVGRDGESVLAQQIPRGTGCIATTSMGRLFDAVASLLGVCQDVGYEGQAAIELEHLARSADPVPLEFPSDDGVLDPLPTIRGLVDGIHAGVSTARLAAGFHAAVVAATVAVASASARAAGIGTIGLTGGVFVNRLVLDGVGTRLADAGFDVLTHRILPCNDGGLALGQAVIAAALAAPRTSTTTKGGTHVPGYPRQGDRDLGRSGHPHVHG